MGQKPGVLTIRSNSSVWFEWWIEQSHPNQKGKQQQNNDTEITTAFIFLWCVLDLLNLKVAADLIVPTIGMLSQKYSHIKKSSNNNRVPCGCCRVFGSRTGQLTFSETTTCNSCWHFQEKARCDVHRDSNDFFFFFNFKTNKQYKPWTPPYSATFWRHNRPPKVSYGLPPSAAVRKSEWLLALGAAKGEVMLTGYQWVDGILTDHLL